MSPNILGENHAVPNSTNILEGGKQTKQPPAIWPAARKYLFHDDSQSFK